MRGSAVFQASIWLGAVVGVWALTGLAAPALAAPALAAEIGMLEAIDQVLTTPEGVGRVLAIEGAIGAVVFYWLWRSRHDHAPEADPHEEVRRYIALVIWLSVHTAVVFTAGSIFAHQDSTWYATSVQQSGIMPAHRLIFFVNIPAYIIIGGGAYLYAKTRLPNLAKRSKLAFAIVVFAPFSFVPAFSAAYLDHSYDIAESLYVAVYGLLNVTWVIGGMGTLLSRSLRRIVELTA